MAFECFVRVRVVQEMPLDKHHHGHRGERSESKSRSRSARRGSSFSSSALSEDKERVELVDMYQAAVTLIASNGTRINLGRPDPKSEGNWRVGKLDLPNTYRFSAQLMNYGQSNMTAPMHFDRNSWMESDHLTSGSMDFTIHMQLEPRLFVEVVDAQDNAVVLPDARTELVKLDASGRPLDHGEDAAAGAVTTLGAADGVAVEIPATCEGRAGGRVRASAGGE